MEDTELGRKIYVRPNAKKVNKKVGKVGHVTPAGRARQVAAVKAYWARWREEHGKNPVTTEEAAKIVKKKYRDDLHLRPGEEIQPAPLEVLVKLDRSFVNRCGEALGLSLGRSFGEAVIAGIKRAQEVRQKGTAEASPPPK